MDNLRGQFSDHGGAYGDAHDYDLGDDETGRELPPAAIGQDERRMQVRAYNFWAGMLNDRNFPAVEDLDPESQNDFGPYSVLLDFTSGIENPAIAFLGDKLAEECGTEGPIEQLSDVPSRSLLSRITDHYLQIIANQAPIGFEAEFVNQRGITILYRGILLPFSSDDDTIDFIYGVINWKELADQKTADELLLQIDQALEPSANEPQADEPNEVAPLTDWADGPNDNDDRDILDLGLSPDMPALETDIPEPEFATLPEFEDGADEGGAGDDELILTDPVFEQPADDLGLADWLASARELAQEAKDSETRTRQALYAAISRAYDFSLAATHEPEEFRQLLEDAGLTVQERAPMTPVVKLVFGIDYDKTRLTEYASALSYAHRLGLGLGELAEQLTDTPGGLKGILAEERRLRREESGKPVVARDAPRKTLARKLRKLETSRFEEIPAEGSEFTLLVARRMPDGEVVLLGEVSEDISLLERAAKHLLK